MSDFTEHRACGDCLPYSLDGNQRRFSAVKGSACPCAVCYETAYETYIVDGPPPEMDADFRAGRAAGIRFAVWLIGTYAANGQFTMDAHVVDEIDRRLTQQAEAFTHGEAAPATKEPT